MTNASVLSKKKHLDKGAHPYFSTTASLKEGNNSTKTASNLELSRFSHTFEFFGTNAQSYCSLILKVADNSC